MLENFKDKLSDAVDTATDAVTDLKDKSKEHLTTDTGSVNVSIIISIVLILIVIYIGMYYHRQSKFSPYLLLDIKPTGHNNKHTIVHSNKIPDSKNSGQYSYSFWIYVSSEALSNKDSHHANYKIIFTRGDGTKGNTNLVCAIDTNHKKLLIRHALINKNVNLLNDEDHDKYIKCDVENVQYDRFVHVAVVKYGYTMVVYINGILVKSKTSNSHFQTLNSSDNLYNYYHIDDNTIYNAVPGWYSKIRYFVDFNRETGGALNDKQVYDLYLNSPYPSLLEKLINSIFGKLISFKDDDSLESKYDKYKKQMSDVDYPGSSASGDETEVLRKMLKRHKSAVNDFNDMEKQINYLYCKSGGSGNECSKNTPTTQ